MSGEMSKGKEGCTCQQCRKVYQVDLLLPDDLWDKIKSDGKCDGAGMLCGSCIMDRIEKISGYDAWILSKELPVVTGKWLYDIMNNMDYDDTFEKLADEINKFIRGEV